MSRKDKILEFIIGYIQEHGYSPSYDEIGEGAGLKSKSSTHRHIKKMMELGVLETDAGECSARAIRVPGYRFVKADNDLISRQAVYDMLHGLGGCDAMDDWSKGYDEAIDGAISDLGDIPSVFGEKETK